MLATAPRPIFTDEELKHDQVHVPETPTKNIAEEKNETTTSNHSILESDTEDDEHGSGDSIPNTPVARPRVSFSPRVDLIQKNQVTTMDDESSSSSTTDDESSSEDDNSHPPQISVVPPSSGRRVRGSFIKKRKVVNSCKENNQVNSMDYDHDDGNNKTNKKKCTENHHVTTSDTLHHTPDVRPRSGPTNSFKNNHVKSTKSTKNPVKQNLSKDFAMASKDELVQVSCINNGNESDDDNKEPVVDEGEDNNTPVEYEDNNQTAMNGLVLNTSSSENKSHKRKRDEQEQIGHGNTNKKVKSDDDKVVPKKRGRPRKISSSNISANKHASSSSSSLKQRTPKKQKRAKPLNGGEKKVKMEYNAAYNDYKPVGYVCKGY